MLRIAITGAGGRMGRRIAALAVESGRFRIVAAMEAPGHQAVGRDVGELAAAAAIGVAVGTELDRDCDVLIDFSLPEGTMKFLPVCRARKIAAVIGTTGLSSAEQAEVAAAAGDVPVVQAANFSVGVNVLLKAAAMVARALGDDYDVEIAEMHHRFKKDAPSGTAIALARSVCQALGRDFAGSAVFGRAGQCPRKPGEIGIHALRVGDTVGEHAVHFGNLGETVTLAHSAHTRDTFARGALRAAEWVAGRTPGLYTMQQVLGLA